MYDPTALSPIDTADEDWALAWARKFSHDTQAPEQYSDAEWLAELEATQHVIDGVIHYRPHIAAADVIESNPDWELSDSLAGSSATYRDAAVIADAIRRRGAWIDEILGIRVRKRVTDSTPIVVVP